MPSVMFLYLMAHDLHQFPQLFLINVLYLSHTIIIPKLAKKRKEKKETINAFGKIVKIVALLNRSTCFTKVQLINIHQSHNFYHTCKHIC